LTDAEAATLSGANVVVLGTTLAQVLPSAQLVLPVTNVAEEGGTFVNRDGRVQRYQQARSAPGMARPAWWVGAQASGSGPFTVPEAFKAVAADNPALAGMSYGELGLTGRVAAGVA